MSSISSAGNEGSLRGEGWRRLWREQTTPWDLGGPTPALLHALELGAVKETNPTSILVPGCGSGWDLPVLQARFPRARIVGLEISDIAADAAREQCPSADVHVEDFFEHHGRYDLVYDVTFFCAIRPALRPQWAEQMRTLIKPGGRLLCVVFPTGGSATLENGPPFLASLSHYQELLVGQGFELTALTAVPDEENHPKRRLHECIALFTRQPQ